MKETGLMFKAPLVRSILDGSKTQTRRLVKPAPARDQVLRLITPPSGTPYAFSNERIDSQNLRRIRWDCQVGGPGDRIYVRETFAHGIHAMAAAREEDGPFVYAADGTTEGRLGNKWTPCLLMPKYVARIWLDITGVRLERLQNISEADAKAEGVDAGKYHGLDRAYARAFSELWESTGGDWAANPWVWVIDFKRDPRHKATP